MITDEGAELQCLDDLNVRLSLSWKSKVYADGASADVAQSDVGAIALAEVLGRFAQVMDEPLAATGDDALGSIARAGPAEGAVRQPQERPDLGWFEDHEGPRARAIRGFTRQRRPVT